MRINTCSNRLENEIALSIGIIAWNEEAAIVPMLKSLFEQSLFSELAQRGLNCEIVCVANGCTDGTVRVATEILQQQKKSHAARDHFVGRVVDLSERGKLNAWNQFVHSISAPSASFLMLIDADIMLHKTGTLWSMLKALMEDSEASITVDIPRKDIAFKSNQSLRHRLSLQASEITSAASAQLCAQLYCIRTDVARSIYLPRDLGACEDGFIKQLVCTDFLTRPVNAGRIVLAPDAEHTFEAYTSPFAVFKNQKRQIIGQTVVHVLVDKYLKKLSCSKRDFIAATLKEKDLNDPKWLKSLIHEHLKNVRVFWRLYPGLLTHRWRSLSRMSVAKRLKCFPAALAGSLVAFISSWMAYRALKSGSTTYWPKAQRAGLASTLNEGENFLGVQTNHS